MYKIYGKCKIFLMGVVISFKYGKRFRFASSFNNFFNHARVSYF